MIHSSSGRSARRICPMCRSPWTSMTLAPSKPAMSEISRSTSSASNGPRAASRRSWAASRCHVSACSFVATAPPCAANARCISAMSRPITAIEPVAASRLISPRARLRTSSTAHSQPSRAPAMYSMTVAMSRLSPASSRLTRPQGLGVPANPALVSAASRLGAGWSSAVGWSSHFTTARSPTTTSSFV